MSKPLAKIDWIHPTMPSAKFDLIGRVESSSLMIVIPAGATADAARYYEGISSSDFQRLREARSKSEFMRREFGINL